MLHTIQKLIESNREPALVRHYYTMQELQDIPVRLLQEHGCYPDVPGCVDIEFFAESIANVDYVAMPDGCLGVTQFGYHQKPTIYLSNTIASPVTPEQEGRMRFVIAHECGHVIMQNWLYERACEIYNLTPSLYAVNFDESYRTACYRCYAQKDYSRYRWYEWQASTAGAHLLMPPKHLENVITTCIWKEAVCPIYGPRASQYILPTLIQNALQSVFKVSQATARIAEQRFYEAHPFITERIFAAANRQLGYA